MAVRPYIHDHGIIEDKLATQKVDLVVREYKAGKLKAREAWKLSGLNYQDFLDKTNLS